MVFYIIGLGLGDERDISLRGLEAVRSCSRIYLESYTSLLLASSKDKMEELYGKQMIVADRDLVESGSDEILAGAKDGNVAFLVVGDPLGATTHTDFILRARELQIDVQVIHNAGIMNAVACCGLQLYKFGQCVTLCFWTEHWKPDSWYDKVLANRRNDMHTLLLLDIKVKEQSEENLLRGRKIYEPPRFMTANQAIEQMLEVERNRKGGLLTEDSPVVALARVGTPTQKIAFGTMREVAQVDMGAPLHCVVLPAEPLHPLELDFLRLYAVSASSAAFPAAQ
eukprot:m51a1_g4388 putative diphthine synthase (282) ;mRNA; f:350810-352066